MPYPPSDINRIQKMFFGFCKKVLRNSLSNYYRRESIRYAHETPMQDDLFLSHHLLRTSDIHPSDYYVLQICCWSANIEDEHLYYALTQLPENQLVVIVLYYWYDLAEAEIANILHVPRPTVHYRKSQAIKRLQRYLTKEDSIHGS